MLVFAFAYERGGIKKRRKIAAGWSFAEFNYTHPAAKHVLRDKLVCVIVHGRLCVAGVPLVEHGVSEKLWILIATRISLVYFIYNKKFESPVNFRVQLARAGQKQFLDN
jgi:hypothetical protein